MEMAVTKKKKSTTGIGASFTLDTRIKKKATHCKDGCMFMSCEYAGSISSWGQLNIF